MPFINKRSLGAVSGIVGAGGNVGAVCYAQFYLHSELPLESVFAVLGVVVAAIGLLGFAIRFSADNEAEARDAYDAARRQALA